VKKTPQQMVEKIRQITEKLHFPPGSKWEYSNSNYVLLGVIAERVTGQRLADLFNARLFSRAGLKTLSLDARSDVVESRVMGYIKDESSFFGFRNAEWLDPTIPGAAGALRGTASDLYRWNSALFDGRIVSPKSVRTMTAPGMLEDGRTTKFGMPQSWQDGLDSDYGMGVFIKQTLAGLRIFHSGDIDGFSTWLAYYPQSKISIVMLVNSESTSLDVDAVEKAVFGKDEAPCVQRRDGI
jgi:CubicO group peptidase (beta-lactamase class C family)